MNKHLAPYLTHESPSLRSWVKSRINRTDQVYQVIEGDIHYIPEEHQYVYGAVNINDQGLKSLNRTVLYCKRFYCNNNQLTELPDLPFCDYLICYNNQLTKFPNLPVCKILGCEDNQLTQLPDLPRCKILYCHNNQLTSLPDLPVCETLDCSNNQLTSLPNLPVCEELYCGSNPGHPFK